MSDDLSTASGDTFYVDESLLYSNTDPNTGITTTGIGVSTGGGDLEAVEVVTTDVQSLYSGDDTAYMQPPGETFATAPQLFESSQTNNYSVSTENVQFNSCIQSFEDPQLDPFIQQTEQQQLDSRPDKSFETIESSQSFGYASLEPFPSQHESQFTNQAQANEHTETVVHSQSEVHFRQPMHSQEYAQPEGIVYQDPHPIAMSHMSQSPQPVDANPSYVPIQMERYSDPSVYEQVSATTTTTTNFGHPSGNDNVYVGLDQPNVVFNQPMYSAHQPQNVTDHKPTHGHHAGNQEGTVAGHTVATGISSLHDRSIDTAATVKAGLNAAAAINAGVGAVSTAVNVLLGDAAQGAAETATNALMGDPVAAVQAGLAVVMSGVRIGASIGSWNETRQKRKESQIQLAAMHGATNPVIMSTVAIATQLDEALLVLSVLGQRLVVLEVINLSELPGALAVCRTACAQADSNDLLGHFDTLDGTLQYTVTAALFFCAACWPMHIYRGFGTGVLDNFLWGCPHPQYSNGQTAGFRAIDRWISFLKSMPRGVHLLTRMPIGLNRLVPTYGKNERMERRRLMNAYKQFVKEIEARGHPQPKDGSFRIVSWHIPFATWNSPFTFKSSGHYWEDFIRWQMDPGRLLHAWTIGGHLDLSYGEMMWLPSGVAESVARFLVGLPGTTFRLIQSSALDYSFLRLSAETRRAILEEGFETVKAVRDPQAEFRRPAMNQNMFVPAPPPVIRKRPTLIQNPVAAPTSHPKSVPYMVPQARPSGPSGEMVQPPASQIAAHQQVGSSSAMPNMINPQMTQSTAHQNIIQPIPTRTNGSMLPQHMSNLAAQQSAHSPANSFPASQNTSAISSPISNSNPPNLSHPNSQSALQYQQTPNQTASPGTMPHQQRLSSMPNIHALNLQGQPSNPHSVGHHPNQRVPSMPNIQPPNGPIGHPNSNPLAASSQPHPTSASQLPAMHASQSNANEPPQPNSPIAGSPSEQFHDPSAAARSPPMDGFSMSRPQHQSPNNVNHSMVTENPHINPLIRRSTNPSTVSIAEGHPTTDFHPFPSNPQVHPPKSSVSRASTVSSQHSSSSLSSAQPQSSMTSYNSQPNPIASPLSSTVGPVSAPPFSINAQPQYPFPSTAQQPVVQKSGPVKRRAVPPPPPPPPPPPAVRKVKAIHPFEPEDASELKFAVGDLLDVLNDNSADGWWEARLDGKVGSIPASYVEDI